MPNEICLSELKVGAIINISSGLSEKWRDDRKVHLAKTERSAVQSSKDIPATLDGEKVNLGRSAEIDFVSRALTVLVPAS